MTSVPMSHNVNLRCLNHRPNNSAPHAGRTCKARKNQRHAKRMGTPKEGMTRLRVDYLPYAIDYSPHSTLPSGGEGSFPVVPRGSVPLFSSVHTPYTSGCPRIILSLTSSIHIRIVPLASFLESNITALPLVPALAVRPNR